MKASVGSNVAMERAFLDEKNGQAICCWNAPDRKIIDDLFAKADVKPESIREVTEWGKGI